MDEARSTQGGAWHSGVNKELMDAVTSPYMISTVHQLTVNCGNYGKQKSYQGNEHLDKEFYKFLSIALA